MLQHYPTGLPVSFTARIKLQPFWLKRHFLNLKALKLKLIEFIDMDSDRLLELAGEYGNVKQARAKQRIHALKLTIRG